MMGDSIFAIVLVFLTVIVVSVIMWTGGKKEDDRILQECADFGSFVIDGAKYECLLVGRSSRSTE